MSMNQPRTSSPTPTNNTQRNAIIVVVVLAVIVIGAMLLNNRNNTPTTDANPTNAINQERPPGASQADPTTFANEGITVGDFVAGTALDRDSCVVNYTTAFSGSDTVYVGLMNSTIPANTPVFVRLYRDNVAVEDTDEVSSPEDFQGCLWFQFNASDSAEVLQSGTYEAEIFVNSRPASTLTFSVQ